MIRRLLTLFVCNVVLWTIVTQLNHMLTDMRVYLFVGGLFITYASLTQPFGVGLWLAILSGLVFDANAPVGFGTHMVLFAINHAVVYRLRDRIARNELVSRIVVTVLANLALFIVFAMAHIGRLPVPSILWPRFFIELFVSQVAISLIAPWFFALQAKSLEFVGAERGSFS